MLTELVIITCTIIEIFIIIWGLAQINREIKQTADFLATDLDSKLAAVIANLGINPNAEPINPIQAAIANMIQMRMSQGATPALLREGNGQFVTKAVNKLTNIKEE